MTDVSTNPAMGTFDETGAYIPRQIVDDDLGGMSLEDAISGTIVEFDDGDGRQGRQGRGPARHRLQVRGRHPEP